MRTELDEILDGLLSLPGDVAVRLEVGTECAWSAEVRWTRHPNRAGGPDLSLTLFSVGGESPEACLSECLEQLRGGKLEAVALAVAEVRR